MGLAPDELPPVKLALAISRVWYLPAAAITVGFIALVSLLISLTHAPVANFLFGVAQCSTAWTHGQCPWY